MPVTSKWYNDEQSILYIKFEGSWTLEEYYANFAAAEKMMHSINHKVVTLVDLSDSDTIPAKFMSVGSHADRANAQASNNVQIILFGLNRYLEIIGSLFQRLFPNIAKDLKLVRSLEEALEMAEVVLARYPDTQL